MYEREQRNYIDINTIYDHSKKIDTYIVPFFLEKMNNIEITKVTTSIIEKFYSYLRKLPKKNKPEDNLS